MMKKHLIILTLAGFLATFFYIYKPGFFGKPATQEVEEEQMLVNNESPNLDQTTKSVFVRNAQRGEQDGKQVKKPAKISKIAASRPKNRKSKIQRNPVSKAPSPKQISANTKPSERWIKHLSGTNVHAEVHKRQPLERDCANYECIKPTSFSVVGAIVEPERVRKSKKVFDGEVAVGDAQKTPYIYVK